MINFSDLQELVDVAEIKQRLVLLRNKRKLSLTEAAERVGISRRLYAAWEDEKDIRFPSDLRYAIMLQRFYGCTPDWLWYGEKGGGLFVDKRYEREAKRFLERLDNVEFFYLISLVIDMPDNEVQCLGELIASIYQRGINEKD